MKKVESSEKLDENSKINEKSKLVIFIRKHIIKKTKIWFVIGIVILAIVVSTLYSSNADKFGSSTLSQQSSLISILKQRVIMLVLILLAGWVPYFYIPAIAYISYIFMMSGDMVVSMNSGNALASLLLNALPMLIDIATVSVITAIGIYMCNYTSKKYKYAGRTSFSFLDVKIRFYEMTKKEEKYNELMAKKEKKIEEMEKNDVSIDYLQIIKIVPIVIAINLVITIIEYYIN